MQEAATVAEGDVVYLKGGGKLEGIQVLHADGFIVKIQTIPGVAPLELPRSQVISIEYDEVSPIPVGALANLSGQPANPSVVTGTKLSKEFDQKLFAPLPAESLHVERMDFVAYLTGLAKRLEIPLEIEEEVRNLPESERIWTAEMATDASFITLLESFSKAFPQIQTVFHPDSVLLTLRKEGAAALTP